MAEITETIVQVLAAAETSLGAAEIAEAMDGQSACDIDRQRLEMIFQTLMKLVDAGRLDFDPDDPRGFRLKKRE